MLSAGFFESAEPVDVSIIDMNFSMVEGISHPSWRFVTDEIADSFPREMWGQVWRELGIKWLAQLVQDLGGSYKQYESWNFLLLSAESEKDSEAMLRTGENAVAAIETRLKPLLNREEMYGKHVMLAFTDQDDYYSYVSYFYPDGRHTQSSGVYLAKGYYHIAFTLSDLCQPGMVITHELTHNALRHIRLPLWLNEGVSVKIENEIGGGIRRSILDADLAELHHAYWNSQTIQEFWAGTSFHKDPDSQKLSYSLAEIMITLMIQDHGWDNVLKFVESATRVDAGLDSSFKYLNRPIDVIAKEFLGPGDWRPNRDVILGMLRQKKRPRH